MNRRTVLLATLVLPLGLQACATRLNPLNWFGGSRRKTTTSVTTPAEQADGRLLVREVTELKIEQTEGGAIVRATGLPPSQGWWNADLVSGTRGRPDENGVLTYRFLVYPPPGPTPSSSPRSRRLTAAVFLSDIKLEPIRTIVVQGETNSLSSGR